MSERDYKHVVQDVTNLYIGAKLTYGEMLDIDEIPFKFKVILSRYILKEMSRETNIENHIFFMKKEDMSYMIYKKLKAKFRLYVFDEEKESYIAHDLKIEDIVDDEYLHENMNTIFVEEMHISKINLLGVQ
ncbi:MAG: hypothetical protein J5525_01940 [Lachnospiraceae bacterium]|nr:hypothetical protein [Lachnospiraceae bacterium]